MPCPAAGAAIAALCAVSKGKAIGMIEPNDKEDAQAARKDDKKRKALEGLELPAASRPLCISLLTLRQGQRCSTS